MTCSACIGAVGSIIFDYETLGLSGEALANILTPLCNIALDKDVCRGAIDNYLVSKQNIKLMKCFYKFYETRISI